MFECSINSLLENLKTKTSTDTEVFYNIHCPDPQDAKKIYCFPAVFLHPTGFHLFYVDDTEPPFKSTNPIDRLDYICRVFNSYFFTKTPIRSVIVFSNSRNTNTLQPVDVYDLKLKNPVFSSPTHEETAVEVVLKHLENDEDVLDGPEHEELVLKFTKEGSEPLESDLVKNNCFVKKHNEWVPALKQDSEKVFKLALFGGFLGIHRFYLKSFWTGLLYFFTFGLVGVGWFFDCIEMIVGCFKVKKKYLLPLENPKKSAIKTAGLFIPVIVAVILLLAF